ncbi:MAG: hypothetical protein AAF346_25115 [Pseudomonadota bacterium]
MDWETLLLSAYTLDSSMIAVMISLAALMTFTIHHYLQTGFYTTPIVMGAMFLVGVFGHLTFYFSNIYFSYEPGRNAVIGSSLSMVAFGLLSIAAYCIYAVWTEKSRAERVARAATATPVKDRRHE